jgi:hypothetical protein
MAIALPLAGLSGAAKPAHAVNGCSVATLDPNAAPDLGTSSIPGAKIRVRDDARRRTRPIRSGVKSRSLLPAHQNAKWHVEAAGD